MAVAESRVRRYRPSVTDTLVAINLLVFAWEVLSGTDDDSYASLRDHGALVPGLVLVDGQWWRILTSAFLHAGVPHVALNMLALFQIGRVLERGIGHARLLAVYAISLLTGGLAVVYFSPPAEPTLGASGAIFGLFGALLAIGLRLGAGGRPIIAQMVPILVINLVFTFAVPNISKEGHLGGLAGGFVAGLLLFVMRRSPEPVAVPVAALAEGEPEAVREAALLDAERAEVTHEPPPASPPTTT